MLKQQQTIRHEVSYSGVGLHTGNKTKITFKPASANNGITFIRTDIPNSPVIPTDIDHVLDISRGKVPTLDTLKAIVDCCALFKMNVLQLYTEHTFDFACDPR